MDNETFVPTKASLLKNKKAADLEVVTYESYKVKKRKENQFENSLKRTEPSSGSEFNLKRAKQEMFKFTMAASENASEAKMQLAIKLGAKPPKNKGKNYKKLQAERKQQKESEAKSLSFQQLGKNSIGKSKAKGKSFDRKRKKERGDILNIYGTVKIKSKH